MSRPALPAHQLPDTSGAAGRRLSQDVRRWWLWGLLLLVLLAAFWPGAEPARDHGHHPPVAARRSPPAPQPLAGTRPAANQGDGLLRLTDRSRDTNPVRDLFALQAPPSAARPAPVLSASPVATPLAYTYLGRFDDGGQVRIFLQQGAQSVMATPGQLLADGWRLQAVRASELEFVHEPGNLVRILNLEAK